MSIVFATTAIVSAGVSMVPATAQTRAEPARKTVWSGIFTSGQASRGAATYERVCSHCHGVSLEGGAEAPALTGADFLRNWFEDDLNHLADKVRMRMPADAPGTLSAADAADLVAHVLRQNGFPPGSEELPSDPVAQSAIRIEGRDGPGPVPNFSLVFVVGCLTQTPDAQWQITRSTEPARARDRSTTARAAESTPLGTQTFRLMDAAFARPENYQGQKVEVRGLLMRQPAADTLNVTTIQAVAAACS